jgi:hypothetical protein
MSRVSNADAERLAQRGGVVAGVVGGGEAGHGEREDVGARASHPVHRLGGDDQRVRGVQPARDADDDLGLADLLQPLLQAGHLDVVRLVAVLGEPLGVGWARTGSGPPDARRPRSPAGGERELDRAVGAVRSAWTRRLSSNVPWRSRSCTSVPRSTSATDARGPAGTAPTRRAASRSRRSSSGRPTPGRCWTRPPRPPRTGRRPGSATSRTRTAGAGRRALATVMGEPDRFAITVAPASAASAAGGTGTHMSSQISTPARSRQVGRGEQQVGAERGVLPGHRDLAGDVVAAGEGAGLVELPVGRQVRPWAPRPAPRRGG